MINSVEICLHSASIFTKRPSLPFFPKAVENKVWGKIEKKEKEWEMDLFNAQVSKWAFNILTLVDMKVGKNKPCWDGKFNKSNIVGL